MKVGLCARKNFLQTGLEVIGFGAEEIVGVFELIRKVSGDGVVIKELQGTDDKVTFFNACFVVIEKHDEIFGSDRFKLSAHIGGESRAANGNDVITGCLMNAHGVNFAFGQKDKWVVINSKL